MKNLDLLKEDVISFLYDEKKVSRNNPMYWLGVNEALSLFVSLLKGEDHA